MQNFTNISSSTTLTDSLTPLLNNDKTALSCSSGTAFPVTDLLVGQLCLRTDQAKLYELTDATAQTWTLLLDLTGGIAKVANSGLLNGQAASYYTDIVARLGFTPANAAGQTFTGNIIVSNASGTASESQSGISGGVTVQGSVFASPTGGLWGYGSTTNHPVVTYVNNVEVFRYGTAGQLGVGGANYGAAGQYLKSQGASLPPVWADAAGFPAGTRMSFQQTSAPTGWTKDTNAAINDSLLRLVTGTVSSGGSTAFSTFNGQSSVGATTLSTAQMPSHQHTLNSFVNTYQGSGKGNPSGGGTTPETTQATGGGGSHTHSITTAIKYYDFIIAQKD